jgi:hypothetical protein
MTLTYLIAGFGFPLLLCVICLGLGLLARAIAGALRPVLVLPIGLAAAYVISTLLTWPSATATLAGPAILVLAVVGLVLRRGDLAAGWRQLRGPRRDVGLWLWPALGALGAFLVVAAPELLAGMPTFSGYAHIVDIAHQFDLGAHLAADGRALPAGYLATPYHSAYDQVVGIFLATGYPAGGQGLLGALAQTIGVDQVWLWQTFLAFVAAMGALSAYRLANWVVPWRPLCALAGAIALQGNLLYGYALAGGIKELSSTVFLLGTAAVLAEGREVLTPPRRPLLLALPVSAAFAAFNLTILPWLAVLLAGVFVSMLALALWRRRGRPEITRLVLGWVEAGLLTAAMSAASIQVAAKLAPTVGSASNLGLGNLAVPIPAQAASGIWVTDDIRYALMHTDLTHVMTVVVLVLAAIGVIVAAVKLRLSLAWLAPAGGIALIYVFSKFPPWVEFKADTMTTPIPLLLAFVGCGAVLMARRLGPARWLGGAGAAAVAATVLYGNALAYHSTTLAPYERLHEAQVIGRKFAGQGPTLAPQFDEYNEYFFRNMDEIGLPDVTYLVARPGIFAAGQQIYTVDIDQLDPNYIQYFKLLVLRRSPTESRPPSDFTLAMRTTYYEVWRRTGDPKSVLAHEPLSGSPTERTPALCRYLTAESKAVKATRMAYVLTPPSVVLFPASFVGSPTLQSTSVAFIANGPARATAHFTVPSGGRWQLWLGGSIGRPVTVDLDGRRVGDVSYQPSYLGQYAPVTTLQLPAGAHTVTLVRGGGNLHPGSGNGIDDSNRTVGPVIAVDGALQAEQPLRTAPISQLPALCRARVGYDWIELLR